MCLVLYNNINLKKNYVNHVGFVKSMSDLKFLYLLIIRKEKKIIVLMVKKYKIVFFFFYLCIIVFVRIMYIFFNFYNFNF